MEDEMKDTFALTEGVYYILLSLTRPLHGYGIMQNVTELSRGRVNLAAGTLYGAIDALLKRGWIIPIKGEKGGRKKEYVITELGKVAIHGELARLNELLYNGRKIMGVE
jgi:DNA-binding PadR family transcriptional regulator